MTDFEFWQHLQQNGQMTYGWWYTIMAIPGFIIAVSVLLLAVVSARRRRSFPTRFINLFLATIPTLLTFPALYTVVQLRPALERLGLTWPQSTQEIPYATTINLGAALNTVALWALIGVTIAVPIAWSWLLVNDSPVLRPITNAVRTITNIATRAFGNRGSVGPRNAPYGTLHIVNGQRSGAIEAIRPNAVIGAKGDIQVNDVGVSRSHAQVQVQGNDTYLMDVGSTNGTYIRRNGQDFSLNGFPVPLVEGDEVFLGDPTQPASVQLIYRRNQGGA